MKGRKFYLVEKIIWSLYFLMFPNDIDIYENFKDAIKSGVLFY